jgi:hypothetical protein
VSKAEKAAIKARKQAERERAREEKRMAKEAQTAQKAAAKSAREAEKARKAAAALMRKNFNQVVPAGLKRRISRAMNQRIFCIERRMVAENVMTLAILGSTGNVYHVRVQERPSCDCPDFGGGMFNAGGCFCKHILFALTRVCKLSRHHPLLLKTCFSARELAQVFAGRSSAVEPAVDADPKVVREYRLSNGIPLEEGGKGEEEEESEERRKPLDDDAECAICYELFKDMKAGEKVTWCRAACGNNFHQECFDHWKNTPAQRAKPTCPLCRSDWLFQTASGGHAPLPRAKSYSAGYQNLAHTSGHDRNTTAFFNRRRRRGWY